MEELMWPPFCWNMVLMCTHRMRYVWAEGGESAFAIANVPHMQDGYTAMDACCQEGHLRVAKVLLSHGASLEVINKVGVHV